MSPKNIVLASLFFILIIISPKPLLADGLDDFVTTWKTDNVGKSEDNQIFLDATVEEGYPEDSIFNFNVDWGDGTPIEMGITTDVTHTYATSGIYQIRISGVYSRIYFEDAESEENDSLKLLSVDQWGTQQWKSLDFAFQGCKNMQILAQDLPDLSSLDELLETFSGAEKMNSPLINDWDMSKITNISGMFRGATSFNQPLDKWDTSKMVYFENTFSFATSFNQPLSNWTKSKVESINSMFMGATSFNQPIESWNVSECTTFEYAFQGATSFNQPLNRWDTSKGKNFMAMFMGATSFNQPLNNWNTSNAITFFGMFDSAVKFNQPLDNWNTEKVKNMQEMFREAKKFDQPLNSWNYSSISLSQEVDEYGEYINESDFYGDFSNFLDQSGLSAKNYDDLLKALSLQDLEENLTFGASNINFCRAEAERDLLISRNHWTILDDGLDCSDYDENNSDAGMMDNNSDAGMMDNNSDAGMVDNNSDAGAALPKEKNTDKDANEKSTGCSSTPISTKLPLFALSLILFTIQRRRKNGSC